MSLRAKIEERFEELYALDPDRWVVKEDVCKFAQRNGFSSENAGRRLREMESGTLSDGKTCPKVLEVRYVKGEKGQTLAYYRYLPDETFSNERAIAMFDALP